jgi:hypothetical protein
MSTISVDLSRRLARSHADKGQKYIAAPVFGRPDAEAAGKLFIVSAGPSENPIIKGMSLFHCHLLNHEAEGMMATILFS